MTNPRLLALAGHRTVLAAVAWLLLPASGVLAQDLTGTWGSPLYQVQLTVNGSQLSGSFTSLATPGAAPGKITGQVKADGQSCTAQWTFAASDEPASFSTWLQLTARGRLLSGYRWSDDAPPAAFALHRASNGQVPVLPDQDTIGQGPTPPATKPPTTTPAPPPVTPPTTPGATPPAIEVTICETVAEGQPRNVGTDFTSPKTVLALVRYTNLPPNSALSWVWTRDGKTQATRTEARGGTGWYYHGLQSPTALTPGTYQVTLSLNGNVVTQRRINVRGAAPAPTTVVPSAPAKPKLSLVACEEVRAGEPRNAGTVFTRPRSLVCLFGYEELLPASQVKFVWKRGGKEFCRHLTYVGGTGRTWYGVTDPRGLPAGVYEITVYVRGEAGPKIRVTVR